MRQEIVLVHYKDAYVDRGYGVRYLPPKKKKRKKKKCGEVVEVVKV